VNLVRGTRYLDARYVLDRVVAVMMLIVTTPVLVVISLLVLGLSGRPILFRQQRAGRHGKTFSILKFRTMVVDAEVNGGDPPDEKLITPIGRLLRASSLDELPQLINIIRGEMAFIGPRPSLVDQYLRYTAFQRRRLEVLPGITGLAQVTYRNDAPWSKRIELDVEYVGRAGPLLDVVILARTLGRVATGSGVADHQIDDLG
jgi:lipopolysaccharide/colanic/teichoic acid biosynthesis glycosyltransferase